MRRLGFGLVVAGFLLAACGGEPEPGGIHVVDVSGPLDASALNFMADSIENATFTDQELVVLQINSKAVLDEGAWNRLMDLVTSPPEVPVVAWIGQAPAAAFGGAANLFYATSWPAISPGSEIGAFDPVVAGTSAQWSGMEVLFEERIVSAEDTAIELQPTLRQYLQDLNNRPAFTANGTETINTLKSFQDGVTLKTTTFIKPDLGTRFFRLAVTPEAAFFFLVVGLTVVTFEFFALGPGVAAGVAAISLILGGWGIVTLPVRPWALALTVLGWAVLTAAYQKGGILALTIVGAIFLQVGGTFFVDGAGQTDPRWYLVLPSVLAVLFFFLLAMPTVQRARLSTQTIGRDSLIGLEGVASSDFDPNGTVVVEGARWRATAHREAGLSEGTEIVVTGVDGLFLEIEPAEVGRET